jgi:Tfp pilus assembly protein PilN
LRVGAGLRAGVVGAVGLRDPSMTVTATVDLLPPGLHRRRNCRARLRAYFIAAAMIFLSMGLFGLHAARQARHVEEINQIAARLRATERQLETQGASVRAELARTQRLLHEAERLREGRRWSRVMSFLASQVPDSVLLVMVSTDPPEPGSGGLVRNTARNRTDPQSYKDVSPATLAIRGYALEHADLAAFLASLKREDVFDSVSLLHSKREPFLAGEGVAFTVTCHW